MKNVLAALALASVLSACGPSEPPIVIDAYDKTNPVFGIAYVEVEVRSKADEVEVQDIIVNRGNCKIENRNVMNGSAIIPKTLRFGESVAVSFSGPCEASEVDVVTDQGDWTVSYY